MTVVFMDVDSIFFHVVVGLPSLLVVPVVCVSVVVVVCMVVSVLAVSKDVAYVVPKLTVIVCTLETLVSTHLVEEDASSVLVVEMV